MAAGEALRSALAGLLGEASDAVGAFGSDPCGKAHFLRTRVKRLQSLSRLVPRAKGWREEFLSPLRGLKDLFADVRDAGIVGELAERYAPGEARHLREAVLPDLRAARELVSAAESSLARYLGWSRIGWDTVGGRAGETYRGARKLYAQVSRPGAGDRDFHEWRKRVKRLFYQCEFLGARAKLRRVRSRADRLGQTLGDLQDCVTAEQWLRVHRVAIPEELCRRRKKFRRTSLGLGAVLFDEKPARFRRRLA